MKVKLTKQEKAIERSADSYKPVTKKVRKKIEGVLRRARKSAELLKSR